MKRKLLRALLCVATFAVVWLVVSPASAMALSSAPVCDPRGAIMFAPPPQIQDAELSLDIPADCLADSPLETRNVVPGRGAPAPISFSQEPATHVSIVFPPLVFVERLAAPVAERASPRPGVTRPLERPPQA